MLISMLRTQRLRARGSVPRRPLRSGAAAAAPGSQQLAGNHVQMPAELSRPPVTAAGEAPDYPAPPMPVPPVPARPEPAEPPSVPAPATAAAATDAAAVAAAQTVAGTVGTATSTPAAAAAPAGTRAGTGAGITARTARGELLIVACVFQYPPRIGLRPAPGAPARHPRESAGSSRLAGIAAPPQVPGGALPVMMWVDMAGRLTGHSPLQLPQSAGPGGTGHHAHPPRRRPHPAVRRPAGPRRAGTTATGRLGHGLAGNRAAVVQVVLT